MLQNEKQLILNGTYVMQKSSYHLYLYVFIRIRWVFSLDF